MNNKRNASTHDLLPALALLVVSATLFAAVDAKAATITVDVDPGTGAGVVQIASDGLCSLREAIINANDNAQTQADCDAGSGSRNFLELPAGAVFTLTDAAVSDALGNTGLPYITRALVMGGSDTTIRSGNTCSPNGTQSVGEFRLMLVQGAGVLIDKLTLAQGCADGTGSASHGAAIYLDQGEVTLIQSTLRDNRAHSGAGVYSVGSQGLILFNSTLSGNTATFGAGLNVDGQTDVINSTISDNSTFSLGAGAYLRSGAILNLDFATIDGSASAQPSDIHASAATVNVKNSVFRNARCTADAAPASSWNASGNNLDSGSICANRFGSNVSAQAALNLGPLADNGGPTQTRAVLAGSQAIDGAVDCTAQAGLLQLAAGAPIPSDQRNEPRPQGFACDVGAFESALTLPPQTIYVDEVNGDGIVAIQADGLCSLREAIDNANGNVTRHTDCEAGGGMDTIVLPEEAVFTISDAIVGNDSGHTGLPHIISAMIIEGNGSTIERSANLGCVIDGTNDPGEFRLLYVDAPPSA